MSIRPILKKYSFIFILAFIWLLVYVADTVHNRMTYYDGAVIACPCVVTAASEWRLMTKPVMTWSCQYGDSLFDVKKKNWRQYPIGQQAILRLDKRWKKGISVIELVNEE